MCSWSNPKYASFATEVVENCNIDNGRCLTLKHQLGETSPRFIALTAEAVHKDDERVCGSRLVVLVERHVELPEFERREVNLGFRSDSAPRRHRSALDGEVDSCSYLQVGL